MKFTILVILFQCTSPISSWYGEDSELYLDWLNSYTLLCDVNNRVNADWLIHNALPGIDCLQGNICAALSFGCGWKTPWRRPHFDMGDGAWRGGGGGEKKGKQAQVRQYNIFHWICQINESLHVQPVTENMDIGSLLEGTTGPRVTGGIFSHILAKAAQLQKQIKWNCGMLSWKKDKLWRPCKK